MNRKITTVSFYSIFLNKMHPFYDTNGRASVTLFANDDEIIKSIDETKNKRTNIIKWIFIVSNAQSLQKLLIHLTLTAILKKLELLIKKN